VQFFPNIYGTTFITQYNSELQQLELTRAHFRVSN